MAAAKASTANRLLEDGDEKGAIQAYQEALKAEPGSAKIYYNLALALDKGGDRAGERAALEKSISLIPSCHCLKTSSVCSTSRTENSRKRKPG